MGKDVVYIIRTERSNYFCKEEIFMRAKSNFFKRLGAMALAAGIAFGALAVNVQPVSAAAGFKVDEKKYEKTYKLDDGKVYFEAKGSFPEIKNKTKAAKKINQALTKERTDWIKQSKKKASDAKGDFDSWAADADFPMPEWNYSDEITYEVTNNDGKYFSVLMSGYDYTGGAHGMPYRINLTFNAKTGEKLTAAKLFGTTKAKLNDKVRKLYLKKYDKQNKSGEIEFYGEGATGRETLKTALKPMDFSNSFYVKNGKAVFYVYPYDLGPYAAGFIEVSASVK